MKKKLIITNSLNIKIMPNYVTNRLEINADRETV